MEPHPWGVSTRKDNRLFIHVLDCQDSSLYIPLKAKVKKAIRFVDGSAIGFSQDKDGVLLNYLNNYPILSTSAHKSPSDKQGLNILAGLVVPVGIFFYIRIWLFSKRLDKDLKKIIRNNQEIQQTIKEKSLDK